MHEKLLSLFAKGGYEVIYPEGLSARHARAALLGGGSSRGWLVGRRWSVSIPAASPSAAQITLPFPPRPPSRPLRPRSCCGMMFNSRGFKDAAAAKGAELEAALMKASEGGKWPIVCDTSPCLAQIKAGLSDPALR